MGTLVVEEIDLAALAEALRQRLGSTLETGYLRGRTVIRDTVAAHLRCSEYEAEQLMDTLELQGFVWYPHLPDETHPVERRHWRIGRR
jgi:hypothetical protein